MHSEIRQATLSEMRYLIDGAKNEGWNPGLDDAIPFYFSDPNGFFIEWVDNKKIGCISAVAYDDSFGFIGFYIVDPAFRHQGYGLKLWNHAIAYLGNRTIGLDGVVSEQNNYKKSGFVFHYNNIRFQGQPKGKLNPELKTLDTISFQTLSNYDAQIFGLKRTAFLQHWITMPHSYGLAITDNNQLTGYGVIRKCEKGCKIGPLFADNEQIAHELFLGLVKRHEGSDIFLDVVQTNAKALELALKHGMTKVFETARMYTKIHPLPHFGKVFGVTTFELG